MWGLLCVCLSLSVMRRAMMSGEWLNAAHLGAIQPEALIRSCRTCIHRLMIPHEWSCKLSTFWKPSPFLEEHNPPDKTSPAVTPCARRPARSPRTPFLRQVVPASSPTWTPGTNPRIYDHISQPFSMTSISSWFQP
ncbi:hypothetical protein ATANTOWER_000077 [Ataeniobius toweri]|uniref:Secreted protein n=1 Tax=Ataeniobius toweri TaxID=208326 RepID=A0ABU7B135_9TELE|nr:hypothetical protein [Ataeniobius toweri]